MTILEEQMQALKDLPARVTGLELQILQLRTEIKDGFSAVRSDLGAELHGVEVGLRGELHGVAAGLRTEMHEIRDDLRTEMRGIRDELRGELHGVRDRLSEDIRMAVQETQQVMKVFYEHTLQEIARLRGPSQ